MFRLGKIVLNRTKILSWCAVMLLNVEMCAKGYNQWRQWSMFKSPLDVCPLRNHMPNVQIKSNLTYFLPKFTPPTRMRLLNGVKKTWKLSKYYICIYLYYTWNELNSSKSKSHWQRKCSEDLLKNYFHHFWLNRKISTFPKNQDCIFEYAQQTLIVQILSTNDKIYVGHSLTGRSVSACTTLKSATASNIAT